MDNIENFKDVSHWSSRKLSKRSFCAIVLTCERMKTLVPNFDRIWFAKSLKDVGLVTEENYKRILKNRCEVVNDDPIMIAMRYGEINSLEDIYSMLNFVGLSVASTALRAQVGCSYTGRPMTKVVIVNVTLQLTYYKRLKENMDNNCFKNVVEFLENNIDKMETELRNLQSTCQDRQRSLDKKIVLVVLLIQHVSNTDQRKRILNKMVEDVPNDLDRKSVDMVFYGKMAITEALDDNFEAALVYAERAKSIVLLCQPSFASISALHDITYVYRTMYVKMEDESDLKRLVNESYAPIDTLESFSEEHRTPWNVLLFQFILLSVLGIDLDLGVDVTRRIDQRYIKLAEKLINAMCSIREILPERRKMILDLARARFSEESDIVIASVYAEESQSSVNEYSFHEDETHNIRAYALHLKHKL